MTRRYEEVKETTTEMTGLLELSPTLRVDTTTQPHFLTPARRQLIGSDHPARRL